MTLLIPKRWLGYSIQLNDLLPRYSEILDRFEKSDIPLKDIFGSSSENPTPPSLNIIAFGIAVEPARLLEILELLEGFEPDYLQIDNRAINRKDIWIGAYNIDNEPVAMLSEALVGQLKSNTLDSAGLVRYVNSNAKILSMKRDEI